MTVDHDSKAALRPGTTWTLLGGCCLLAAALRILGSDAKSIWLDEAYSLTWASLSLPDLWTALSRANVHPPLYFAALHFFLDLGHTASVLRGFSALFGVATIPLVYLIGRELIGQRMGLIAALLVATSPWHVAYGQEGRMYTLLTFWAALATYGLVLVLKTRQSSEWKERLPGWIAYVLGTAGALWTHNIAVFLPATATGVVALWWLQRRVSVRFVVAWGLAQLVVLALWTPWLLTFLQQAKTVYGEYWIPPPDPWAVVEVLRRYQNGFAGLVPASSGTAGLALELARLGIDAGTVWLIALGAWRLRARGWTTLTAVLWLGPVIGNLIISQWRPIFLERLVIWASVPVYLLIAAGLADMKRPLRQAMIALILIVNAVGIFSYHRFLIKEQWKEAASYLGAHAAPNELILYHAFFTRLPFAFYHKDFREPDYGVPFPVEHYLDLILKDGRQLSRLPIALQDTDLDRVAGVVAAHPRIWLVSSPYAAHTDPTGAIPCLMKQLATEEAHAEFNAVSIVAYRLNDPTTRALADVAISSCRPTSRLR